jgi:hypothetical protein
MEQDTACLELLLEPSYIVNVTMKDIRENGLEAAVDMVNNFHQAAGKILACC